MKCRDARELINSYIDNGLDPEKDKFLMEHVEKCSRCSEELRFLIEYRKTVEKIRPVKAPDYFMVELNKRLAFEERGTLRRLMHEAFTAWRRFSFPLEAAGVIAVALLIFFLYTPLFHGVKKMTTYNEEQVLPGSRTDQAAERRKLLPHIKEKKEMKNSTPMKQELNLVERDKASTKSESSREEEGAGAVADDSISGFSRNAAEKSLSDNDFKSMDTKESIQESAKKDLPAGGLKRKSAASESRTGIAADISPEKIISGYGGTILARKNLTENSRLYTVKISAERADALIEKMKSRYSAAGIIKERSGDTVTVEFKITE